MVRATVRRTTPSVPIAVTFGEGRRPEHATRIRVGSVPATIEPGAPDRPARSGPTLPVDADGDPAAFDGPLALLLSLIEARQLDVLTVPLGALASAYLEAMGGLAGDRLPYLSAFVAVAAQLILIKSRAMLPREPHGEPVSLADEGPDPEAELRRRLVVYRAYRDAGAWLRERALTHGPLVRREPSIAQAAGLAGARPSAEPPLDPRSLAAALRGVARLAPPAEPPPELVRRTITLAERAEAIREAIRRAPVVVLQELIGGTGDRVVAAVTFLAMLELVKRHEIAVEQDRPWGPIRCRSLGPEAGPGTPPAAPIDESLEDFA